MNCKREVYFKLMPEEFNIAALVLLLCTMELIEIPVEQKTLFLKINS